MYRMSELAQETQELKRCGGILISISEILTEMFSAAGEQAGEDEAEKPIVKKEIKLSDVRAVLAEKSRAGFTKEVKEFLVKHETDKFLGIDASEYETLFAEVEVLGNG